MNVICVLIDSLRRDHVGCYGNEWIKTPGIDRLASQGVSFDQSYIGSYPCMPARRDLWTGNFEFPWRGWGPLEDTDRDLPGLLKEAGITSQLITDHFHYWEKGSGNYHFNFSGVTFIRGQEIDNWIIDSTLDPEFPAPPEKLAGHIGEQGVRQYLKNVSSRKTEEDYFGPQVMREAIHWLERNYNQDNFFLMVESFDPHEPFDPPYPYDQMYYPEPMKEKIIWPNYGHCDLTQEELKQVRALYAGQVTMVDRWFNLLLDKVEQLNLLDDTMIIVCTDHGHMFGEHGIMGKPWSTMADSNLYQELAHTPLVIYHPKNPAPARRVDQLVQLVDLFPTILESFGIPVPEPVQGQSLLPYLLQENPDYQIREYAFYGRFGEAINVTDGTWTLFLWPKTPDNTPLYWYSKLPPQFWALGMPGQLNPEKGCYEVSLGMKYYGRALYNLENDYAQAHNLYDTHPQEVDRLIGAIREWLTAIGAPVEQLERLDVERIP